MAITPANAQLSNALPSHSNTLAGNAVVTTRLMIPTVRRSILEVLPLADKRPTLLQSPQAAIQSGLRHQRLGTSIRPQPQRQLIPVETLSTVNSKLTRGKQHTQLVLD
jgi:hypothetical protein